MAITRIGKGTASASGTTATIPSVALVGGSSLIVCCTQPGGGSLPTGVTWNGNALSQDVGSHFTSIWSIHGVSVDTGDIVVTWSGSYGGWVTADQVTEIDTVDVTDTDYRIGDSVSVGGYVPTSYDDEFAIAIFMQSGGWSTELSLQGDCSTKTYEHDFYTGYGSNAAIAGYGIYTSTDSQLNTTGMFDVADSLSGATATYYKAVAEVGSQVVIIQ